MAITLCRVSEPVDEVLVAIPRGGTEGHTLKRTTPVMEIAEDSFPAMRSSDDGVEVADVKRLPLEAWRLLSPVSPTIHGANEVLRYVQGLA